MYSDRVDYRFTVRKSHQISRVIEDTSHPSKVATVPQPVHLTSDFGPPAGLTR
jgi:hypothetical protein